MRADRRSGSGFEKHRLAASLGPRALSRVVHRMYRRPPTSQQQPQQQQQSQQEGLSESKQRATALMNRLLSLLQPVPAQTNDPALIVHPDGPHNVVAAEGEAEGAGAAAAATAQAAAA